MSTPFGGIQNIYGRHVSDFFEKAEGRGQKEPTLTHSGIEIRTLFLFAQSISKNIFCILLFLVKIVKAIARLEERLQCIASL
ncbi:hypothetical protein AMR41_14965 [Hapalosiphon sp. MRB220]|nr:hypothetical protein AMR41_14965 [Hapalosiphon sp. MRB220]